MNCQILQGDCIEVMRTLPAESVNCCVTSPPYWGLRDYGVSGQIGLEPTPEEYVVNLVAVFREVKRVLRDDGTLWLNLGSSYSAHDGQRKATDKAGPKQQTCRGSTACPSRSSGGTHPNQPRSDVPACGTYGKALPDSQASGRACHGSDGECQGETPNRHPDTARNGRCGPQGEPQTLLKGHDTGRSDCGQETLAASLPGAQASTMPRSSCPHSDALCQESMDEAFRKGRPTDALDAQAFARKAHDSQYKHLPLQTSEDRTSDKELFSEALDSPALISLYHSIASLAYKPKDLVPIPWLVAMALQADGWYLRSDIIWSKPNPMPESVTDRPTKSHEYIFLLSKQEKYYYDQEAILESCSDSTHARLAQNIQDQIGSTRANGGAKTNGNMKAVHRNTGVGWDYTSRVNPGDGRARERIKKEGPNSRMHVPRAAGREDSMPNPSSSSLRDVGIGQNARPRKAAPNGSGTKNNESFNDAMAIMPTMRNKRSVWTVATESFKEAHFATYPQELITPCILAGCPVGGTVLDCFGGSCTTGQVAEKCGRNSILIELNPEYIKIGKRRTAQQGLAL